MADIELVIKIPEDDLDAIKYLKVKGWASRHELLILDGTPLPKGHGRLIDADELKTLSYEVLVDTDNPNREDGLSSANGVVEEDIDLAPTIIEADGGEE